MIESSPFHWPSCKRLVGFVSDTLSIVFLGLICFIILFSLLYDRFIRDFMNAHNMFVDVSIRAVINCSLPLLHGLCMLLLFTAYAVSHRSNRSSILA